MNDLPARIKDGDIEIDNYNDIVLWTGREYVTICDINEIDSIIERLKELKQKFDTNTHSPVEFE